jgi:hypothetical protein
MSSPKTAIRAGSLKSIGTGRGGIAAAESHAKRLDPVAKGRVVHPSDPIAWSKAEGGHLDYVDAFKAHKRETGAGERKGASLAMEFKAVVSPDWLAETGDPRDAANPRVQQLVAEAKAWAESWGGAGAVWAVRYDTDEKGAGVVDLFMSPVRQQQHKGGTSKAVISTRKAKEELLAAEQALDPGLKTSGAAMQSSWARWCQQKLDVRLERGQSKEQTGRDHIHADVYAKVAQEARREALEAVETERLQMVVQIDLERQRAIQGLLTVERRELETLRIENKRLWWAHTRNEGFIVLVKALLQEMLPAPLWESFRAAFNERWRHDPANIPDPTEPIQPQHPARPPSGPSAGPS